VRPDAQRQLRPGTEGMVSVERQEVRRTKVTGIEVFPCLHDAVDVTIRLRVRNWLTVLVVVASGLYELGASLDRSRFGGHGVGCLEGQGDFGWVRGVVRC